MDGRTDGRPQPVRGKGRINALTGRCIKALYAQKIKEKQDNSPRPPSTPAPAVAQYDSQNGDNSQEKNYRGVQGHNICEEKQSSARSKQESELKTKQ